MTDDDAITSEQQRRIQYVLLDMLAAVDVDGIEQLPPDWIGTFATELTELEAVYAVLNDDTDPPTRAVSITPLLSAVLVLLELLITNISNDNDQDRLVVINAIRVKLDEIAAEDD